MKPSIITIYEIICLVISRRAGSSRIVFSEGILITFCRLVSVWLIVCHNVIVPNYYLVVSVVAFEISLQHAFRKNRHGAAIADSTVLSLGPANNFFARSNDEASFRKFRKYAVALCRFLGNTLLRALGAEITELGAVLLPAVTFLQLSVKNLIQKAGRSGYLTPNNS